MHEHLTSPHAPTEIGRGHHREFRLAIAEHPVHQAAVSQAKQAFEGFVAQGGRGVLDITTISFLGVDWACFVYHGQASHALRPNPDPPA